MNIPDLNRLLITDEIRAVMANYVRLADEKEWIKLSLLFTPEGSFTPLDVNGNALAVMKGREDIATTISGNVGQATAIHHLFSYEINVLTETSATGIFNMEDYLIRPEDEMVTQKAENNIPAFRTLRGYGHYHGEYIKVNGIWYISKLVQTRIKLDFTY